MNRSAHITRIATVTAVLLLSHAVLCQAQKKEKIRLDEWKLRMEESAGQGAADDGDYLQYIIENGDTVYVDNLPAAHVYQRLPRQKGREWRQYYRLVHNFSKVYPYALIARHLVKVKYISLGNLIIDKLAFKELIQDDCNAENLMHEVRELIENKAYRSAMLDEYARIKNALGGSGASRAVAADMARDLQSHANG